MRKSLLTPVAAGVLLAMAGTAQAFTRTATFNVTANVANNCSMSAAPMALGTFTGGADLTASSAITVNCTNGLGYTVDLSAGSGSYAARHMTNGTEFLVYNLYTNAAYTTVWGDTTGGTGHVTGTGNGANQTLTVHGRLRAADNAGGVSAVTYTDTITATITY